MAEDVSVAVAVLVALIAVLLGVVIPTVTRRAASGRLARNGSVGIRTRATMTSDQAWRAGHLAARGSSDVAGIMFVLTGLAAFFADTAAQFLATILVGFLTGTTMLALGARQAGRAARLTSGASRADGT